MSDSKNNSFNKSNVSNIENRPLTENGDAFTNAVKKGVKDDKSVVFDVGSNVGGFAHTFLLEGYSKVHLFEPSPCMLDGSKKRLAEFGDRCVFNQVGVSDQKGHLKNVRLLMSWVMCGDGQKIDLPVSPGALELQPTTFDTELITLDEYCENIDRMDLLKIDVEGYEYKVLQGAANTIEKFKPIILLELSLFVDKIEKDSIPKFIDHIYSLEYDVYDQQDMIVSKKRMIKNYPYHTSCDIILYPKTKFCYLYN